MSLPWFLQKDSQYVYTSDAEYLVLDFETTNKDKGSALCPDNRIVLACWSRYKKGVLLEEKYKFGDEYELEELLEDIRRVKFVVAQNSKFEMQWLKRCGLDLRTVLFYDTMLGAWVLDGNRQLERNLDALAARIGIAGKGNLVATLMRMGMCPSTIKQDWLLKYCKQDVDITHRVFVDQIAKLTYMEQMHLVHTRNLTAAVLADIEFEGLTLDPVAVAEEYRKTQTEWQAANTELYEQTGGINLASPKQVGEFLFSVLKFRVPTDHRGKEMLTGKGAPSTSTDALSRLVAKTPKQEAFLDLYRRFNRLDSLLTKNLVFFKGVCDEYGGKFFGSFNLGRAGTHRLTSSGKPLLFAGEKKPRGIQLQNVPREYKRLFWSGHEDWVVVEGDGAQLEFRVAADLCRDPVAIKEIAEDVDVHTITANFLFEHGHPGFDTMTAKERRQDSKAFTFKPLYGGASGSDAVVEYCEFFKAKYTYIANEQYSWALRAIDTKQQRTPYGMTFYWPGTKMNRGGYITNTTQIYNYPVQGFATGEIIPIALVHFWHRSAGAAIRIFTTIHDSIGAIVHKDAVEICKQLLKQSLTDDVYRYLREIYDYEFVTPLGVGVKASRNWGTASSESIWNVFPDGTFTFKEK
jgi:DNA polymerase I-like protein with 3'-5' exonuclease and polymerase domains